MFAMRSSALIAAWGFFLALTGCQRLESPVEGSAEVKLMGTMYQITGPYAHESLSVFLLHADVQDQRDFLTLDQGLKEGKVKITEMEHERVDHLQIDNQSNHPLYLQEGERLSGGKQDRVIIASMVVPPHSGRTALPTFCIEHDRWHEGKSGKEFGFTANDALAPKGVRGASKIEGTQQGVWCCVGVQKVTAQTRLRAPNTNSSGNEMLDAPQIQKISDEYAGALDSILRSNPDAVGVAIVFNGQIEEVDVYPNHALFQRLYPRLVRSYAVQAAMLKDQTEAAKALSCTDLARYLQEGKEKSNRDKKTDARNQMRIRELEGNKFECAARYEGKVVHWQVMQMNGVAEAAAPRAAALGSKY
jgi:hypothetical protein